MTAQKTVSFGLYLIMCLLLISCVPKKNATVVEGDMPISENASVEPFLAPDFDVDRDNALCSEMDEACARPGSIVGSANTTVLPFVNDESVLDGKHEIPDLALADAPKIEGNAPEVKEESKKVREPIKVKKGKMGKTTISGGSVSERKTAALNTKRALCSGSETLCVTSAFGVGRRNHRHKGVDIRAPYGSPVMAFKSGVVTMAQYYYAYGNMIEIRQADGITSRYAHLSQMLVKEGTRVTQGQMIGRVGTSGRASGPHLHFELIRNNQTINPMIELRQPKALLRHATAADREAALKAAPKRGKKSSKSKASYKTKNNKKSSKAKNVNASASKKVVVTASKNGNASATPKAAASSKKNNASQAKNTKSSATKKNGTSKMTVKENKK